MARAEPIAWASGIRNERFSVLGNRALHVSFHYGIETDPRTGNEHIGKFDKPFLRYFRPGVGRARERLDFVFAHRSY